jgi:glutathione S-transferase
MASRSCPWAVGLPSIPHIGTSRLALTRLALLLPGKDFTQSLAALRYAGKKGNLYPKDDLEALAVDEVLDIVQDILTKAPQDPDETAKLAKRAEYAATGKMHSLVSLLNKRAEQDPSPWLVGSDMTIADLCVYFGLMKMIRDGDFDGVPTTYIDSWPALVAVETAVPIHPVFKVLPCCVTCMRCDSAGHSPQQLCLSACIPRV